MSLLTKCVAGYVNQSWKNLQDRDCIAAGNSQWNPGPTSFGQTPAGPPTINQVWLDANKNCEQSFIINIHETDHNVILLPSPQIQEEKNASVYVLVVNKTRHLGLSNLHFFFHHLLFSLPPPSRSISRLIHTFPRTLSAWVPISCPVSLLSEAKCWLNATLCEQLTCKGWSLPHGWGEWSQSPYHLPAWMCPCWNTGAVFRVFFPLESTRTLIMISWARDCFCTSLHSVDAPEVFRYSNYLESLLNILPSFP